MVPARGSSKRIKYKNLRLLHGKPLISYILETITQSKLINDIVVTSEDPEILAYARGSWNVMTQIRPEKLSKDEVTLDPVVYEAVHYIESISGNRYDVIVTLQPTSPILKIQILDEALQTFIGTEFDSCISVIEDTHLRWKLEDEIPYPLYEERLNRQWLPKVYKETGAFLISRRDIITPSSRLGKNIMIYPISREQGVDIDDEVDWRVAEAILSKVHIAFVVYGNPQVGMGHIYRTLTLADFFLGNTIKFFTFNSNHQAIGLIKDRGFEIESVTHKASLLPHLNNFNPDIVINDILDTDRDYITYLRSNKYFVVNFEDLGEGSLHANLVFNALYEYSTPPPNHRFGAQYVCLGPNFLITPPASFREEAATLLITFGGSDANNLTLRTCKIIPKLFKGTPLEKVLIVLGLGYVNHEKLAGFLQKIDITVRSKIELYQSVKNMAQLMSKSDVAVTSNGRTIYELAAMGVPGICISQNDRETLHLFSRYSKGFKYLGISSTLDEKDLFEALKEIVTNRELRYTMRKALLSVNLRAGIYRVKSQILDQYLSWEYENSHNRQTNNS